MLYIKLSHPSTALSELGSDGRKLYVSSRKRKIMQLSYPVVLERDESGTILVDFVDFPNVHTCGRDEQEALIEAMDALESAFDLCFQDGIAIPLPSTPEKKQKLVNVSPMVAVKVQIWNEMHVQNLRRSDLALRLNVRMTQIDRLFNTRYPAKFEVIENAARALGKNLVIGLV